MGLGDEKYLALTTYKKAGDAVVTPVWVVTLSDGSMSFWTSSGSGKAKRLAHTPKVLLQPCDVRGRLTEGTTAVEGSAVVVGPDDPRYAETQVKVREKYGLMTKITRVFNSVGGMAKGKRIPYADRAVVMTLS